MKKYLEYIKIVLGVIFIIALIFNKNSLEKWYYTSQIILLFIAIIGGYFAYKAFVEQKRANDIKEEIELQKEKNAFESILTQTFFLFKKLDHIRHESGMQLFQQLTKQANEMNYTHLKQLKDLVLAFLKKPYVVEDFINLLQHNMFIIKNENIQEIKNILNDMIKLDDEKLIKFRIQEIFLLIFCSKSYTNKVQPNYFIYPSTSFDIFPNTNDLKEFVFLNQYKYVRLDCYSWLLALSDSIKQYQIAHNLRNQYLQNIVSYFNLDDINIDYSNNFYDLYRVTIVCYKTLLLAYKEKYSKDYIIPSFLAIHSNFEDDDFLKEIFIKIPKFDKSFISNEGEEFDYINTIEEIKKSEIYKIINTI